MVHQQQLLLQLLLLQHLPNQLLLPLLLQQLPLPHHQLQLLQSLLHQLSHRSQLYQLQVVECLPVQLPRELQLRRELTFLKSSLDQEWME